MTTSVVADRLRNRLAARASDQELRDFEPGERNDGGGGGGGLVLPDRRQQRARDLDELGAKIRLRMTRTSTPLDIAPVLAAVLRPREVPRKRAPTPPPPTTATTTDVRPLERAGRRQRSSPAATTAEAVAMPRDPNPPTDFPSYQPLLARRDVCQRLCAAWLETDEPRGADGLDSSRRIQRLVRTRTRDVLEAARACLPAAVANELRRIREATLEAIAIAGAAADDLHATPIMLLFACQETVVDLLTVNWIRRRRGGETDDDKAAAAAAVVVAARIDVPMLSRAASSHAELLAVIAGSLCAVSVAHIRRRSRVSSDGVVHMSARDRFQIAVMRRLAVADFRVAEFGRIANLPVLADAHVRRSIDVYRTLFGNPLQTWYEIVQSQTTPPSIDSNSCLTVIVDWIGHCLRDQPGHFNAKVANLRRSLDRARAIGPATTAPKRKRIDADLRPEVRVCRDAHLTVWETFAAYFLTLDRVDHLVNFWQHAVTTVAYGAVGRRQVLELMKVVELRVEREMASDANAGLERNRGGTVPIRGTLVPAPGDGDGDGDDNDGDNRRHETRTVPRVQHAMDAECRHLSEIALARSRLGTRATPRRARDAVGGLRLAVTYHRSRVRAERLKTREFELKSVRAWTDVLVALLSVFYVLRAHSELLHLASTAGIEALHALHVLIGAAPKPAPESGGDGGDIVQAVSIWGDLSLRVKCILWLHTRRPTSRAIGNASSPHSFDNDVLAAIRNGNVSEPCMPWHGELVEVFSYRLKAARRDGS